MFAPVAFLATGACFATTKDVVQLQADVNNARLSQEQRITRLEQQQAARFDSLAKLLRASLDTLRAVEGRFFNTGGNISADTRGVESKVNILLARIDAFITEQENQGKELKLLSEQVRGINAALAADTARTDPVEGAMAKFSAGERQMERSPGVARELFEQAIALNPDSATAAMVYKGIAETFKKESKYAEADSVYRIVFDRYPNSAEAPNALYLVALSLHDQKKYAEARVLYQRVIDKYPTSTSVGLAQDGLRRLPPPQSR